MPPSVTSIGKPPPGANAMGVKQDTRTALHLFSGPSNRKDGISSILRAIGWECDDIDICNTSPEDKGANDLLSDSNWISIHSKLRQGKYIVVFMGTPRNTFSRLRSHPGDLRRYDQKNAHMDCTETS